MLNANEVETNPLRPDFRSPAYADRPASGDIILVVEDEDFVRNAACDILEREGYRVLRARNAAEAHAAFHGQREGIHLLLSDVVLPGQNGPELAKALRATQPALKAIFVSGYPENTVTRYGLRTAGISYLSKPFSAESLLKQVKRALESETASYR